MKSRLNLFHQAGAWLSMVVHLLAVSGMAQSGIAVLAAAEGAHSVGLQSGDQGQVLVLAHQRPATLSCNDRMDRIEGRHSSVVHTLLWMAHPQDVENDHLIALTPSSSQFQPALERLVDRPAEAPFQEAFPTQPLPCRTPYGSAWARFSTPPSLLLLSVKSTVLLI